MGLEIEAIHTKMQERYALAATGAGCCNGNACCASDYSADELARIPAASVLGLGSGNPVRFAEAFRILKPGGRLAISDIVQDRDLGKIEDDCGCVATAMVRAEYLNTIRHARFRELHIAEDRAWRTGPNGVEASAVTPVAR